MGWPQTAQWRMASAPLRPIAPSPPNPAVPSWSREVLFLPSLSRPSQPSPSRQGSRRLAWRPWALRGVLPDPIWQGREEGGPALPCPARPGLPPRPGNTPVAPHGAPRGARAAVAVAAVSLPCLPGPRLPRRVLANSNSLDAVWLGPGAPARAGWRASRSQCLECGAAGGRGRREPGDGDAQKRSGDTFIGVWRTMLRRLETLDRAGPSWRARDVPTREAASRRAPPRHATAPARPRHGASVTPGGRKKGLYERGQREGDDGGKGES